MYKVVISILSFAVLIAFQMSAAEPPAPQAPKPGVVLPLDRTAYFIGEKIPLGFRGFSGEVKLEAVNTDGRTLLYAGAAAPIFLDSSRLASGTYEFEVNGMATGQQFYLNTTLRRSAASLQDECEPPEIKLSPEEQRNPVLRAEKTKAHANEVSRLFKESGLTASISMAKSDMGRAGFLDAMARSGALLMVNPDTRPTSFNPVGNEPNELDGMSQRMMLTAQANARYPNFAGFCYGWDTTGFATNSRLGLLVYWGWGDKTQPLRNYLQRVDTFKEEEFTRRTGYKPVSQAEYIAYVASIGMPELAPAIDLPTKRWLEEVAQYTKPMDANERRTLEKRLDAWSSYLMGLYGEAYSTFTKNLRESDTALCHTASVQVDHCPPIYGQYFPNAYEPLDLRYQSTWNDQVGGPDYLYQWVFVAGLLDMHRNGRPTWISNALGAAHGKSEVPGKFMRVAAHNLAYGGSGIGFAIEGFSNVLGGMNKETNWDVIKSKSAGEDLIAGRDFLARFSTLALEGRGDHGVGILFSKSQFSRQYQVMGFGVPAYRAFIALLRLGYTPRFVTEEDLAAGRTGDIKALGVIGQTFPLTDTAATALAAYQKNGGLVLVDGSTTLTLPGAVKLKLSFPYSQPGKPHNWSCPNLVAGENETALYERMHPEAARAFFDALGDTGGALLRSERGPDAKTTLLQIDGGIDARYIVAVNDSNAGNQANWHQLQETLVPSLRLPAGSVLFDCTDERALGMAKPFRCDLTRTIGRVYAILSREPAEIELKATQSVRTGECIRISVQFLDAKRCRLEALVPFQLSLNRPDGNLMQDFFRSTQRDGTFAMNIPLPANIPVGEWTLSVRSQLDGRMATLPIKVKPADSTDFATRLKERVVVRQRTRIEAMLKAASAKNAAAIVIPVFESARSADIRAAAEKVKAVLVSRGIEVEIQVSPPLTNYVLSYSPTPAQKEENARVERGDAIGRIKRETVNNNDWFSALSKYRFSRPVILLDLAGETGDNPMAEALGSEGLLWPEVSEAFPSAHGAVIQGIHWAFGPRTTAVVIQAADVEGLLAGAEALANLPQDQLTDGIITAKSELWRQFHVGGKPEQAPTSGLSSENVVTVQSGRPFEIHFPGAQPAEGPRTAMIKPKATVDVPGIFEPKQYTVQLRDGGRLVDSDTVELLIPDLRFSDAIQLIANVKSAGTFTVRTEGVFRYSDRKPCWQASWEDIINLRERTVPKERRAMVWDILVNGKLAGKLVSKKTAELEVQLELASPTAGMKPKTQVEDVVVELSGRVELPAGRAEIQIVHRNVVDGKLNRVSVEQ